ncbi:hypothetical protein KIPB_012756, partial [Kipferlia bialata]
YHHDTMCLVQVAHPMAPDVPVAAPISTECNYTTLLEIIEATPFTGFELTPLLSLDQASGDMLVVQDGPSDLSACLGLPDGAGVSVPVTAMSGRVSLSLSTDSEDQ